MFELIPTYPDVIHFPRNKRQEKDFVSLSQYKFTNMKTAFIEKGSGVISLLDRMRKKERKQYLNGQVFSFKRESGNISFYKPIKVNGYFDYNRDYTILQLKIFTCNNNELKSYFIALNIDDHQYSIWNGKIKPFDFANQVLKFMKNDIYDISTLSEIHHFGEKMIKMGAVNNTG